jgi:hypothetical protein
LTIDEYSDKDHEKDACLFVEIFVGCEDHKEKDVSKILDSIRCSNGLHENVNQNEELDVGKGLENESPAGPVTFLLDPVIEERKNWIPPPLRLHLVVTSNLGVEEHKQNE